jgi:hypothetical protein
MEIKQVEYITGNGTEVLLGHLRPADEAGAVRQWKGAVPEWPAPLAEHAFHGLAGEIVQAVEPHTEADPVALLVQLVVAFGNAIGNSPHFRVEADKHHGNLFAVVVGVTSAGRKGTSWGHVRELLRKAEEGWAGNCIASGLSSGEGVIWCVRDPIEKLRPVRKKGSIVDYESALEDEGVSDKRALIVETEFSMPLRVMSRDGNTLSGILRDAWDTGNLRILTKNSPTRATGAHISIVGHITREELLRYLNSIEMANGFANRFLWVCARRSKCLPEGGSFHPEDHPELVRRLGEAIAFARGAGEVRRDDDAAAIWRAIYPALSDGRPGLLGSITSRAPAQVVRLSLVYAALDQSEVIRREHLLAALAVWDYCEASARFIFGDSLGNPEADRILKELRRHPEGLTRTSIRNLFSRNRSEAEIEAALVCLAERGLAVYTQEPTEGRPAELWKAIEGTTETT